MIEDDILEEDDDEFAKLNPQIKKSDDILDEDTENLDDLAEEEEEDEEPYDDIDPI